MEHNVYVAPITLSGIGEEGRYIASRLLDRDSRLTEPANNHLAIWAHFWIVSQKDWQNAVKEIDPLHQNGAIKCLFVLSEYPIPDCSATPVISGITIIWIWREMLLNPYIVQDWAHTANTHSGKSHNSTLFDPLEAIYWGIRGVVDLLTMGGRICTNIRDVTAVLENIHIGCIFTAITQGDAAEKRALEQIIELFTRQQLSLAQADGVIVTIAGNSYVSQKQFLAVSDLLETQLGEEATVLVGDAVEETMPNTMLRISVLAGKLCMEKSSHSEKDMVIN